MVKVPYTDDITQGHGTLNAIYASIRKACELNGWDGVDVLIIGGDFQVYRYAPISKPSLMLGNNKARQSATPMILTACLFRSSIGR